MRTDSDTRRSRPALASLSLAVLLSSLGTSIANVALPALSRAFDASFQEVQWVVLAYLLASTALVVGVGRLGDLLGARRLLLAGIVLFTVASAASGAAPSLGALLAARALQGLGSAAMLAPALALAGDAAPAEKTGRTMGLLGAMSAVGTALGPSLGGVLVAAFGWRAVFVVNVPFGAAALLLASRSLPADRRTPVLARKGFDLAGLSLLSLSLAAWALAATLGRGRLGLLNLALLGGAALGAVLFVRVESRVPSPLVRLEALRDPALRTALASSFVVSAVLMATLVVGPFYLSGALGLDAAGVGLVLSAGPIVAALSGLPAGRLVDRRGARRMTAAGLGAVASGALLLALVPARAGVAGWIAPTVLLTAGYALFQAANNTAVLAGASPDQRGVSSGLLNLSRSLGLVTGTAVMGAVFALASGASDPGLAGPEAVARGRAATFAAGSLLVGAALARAARAGRPERKELAAPRSGTAAGSGAGPIRRPAELL